MTIRSQLPLVLFLFGVASACAGDRRLTFDANAWRSQNSTAGQPSVRQRMVSDLTESGRLMRMTKSEVLSLLGPADGGEYFREWGLAYKLGAERGFISIDSEWLVIRFGHDKRVTEVKVLRD